MPARAAAGAHASVLALQRTAGNRAVRRLLDGRAGIARGKDKKGKGGGAGSVEQKKLKAAPNQSEYAFAQLPDDVQTAITQILKGNEKPYLRPTNGGRHSTDPETGLPKGNGIGVREYHVSPSNESKRIVTRTAGKDKAVYYDPSHVAGTYTYHRVNGAPFPAAPVPAPAAAAPVLAPVVAPVLPAVQAPAPLALPEVDDWEQLTG
jgi:guanyl-specific ribonuclease Sa